MSALNAISGAWGKLAAKVDAMTLRERVLVGVAATAATFVIVFFLTVDPAQRRMRSLTTQMQSQKEELAQIEKAGPVTGADPDAANRARVETLRSQIRAADAALQELQRELVPAGNVNALLQEMLARDSDLALVSLKTLAVEPLVQSAKPRDGKAAEPPRAGENAPVYKHGVEITVQGTYSGLHDYLARLERLPSRMYWWRARLNADDDAKLTLSVTVYTLSLDRAWLQV
jgi:MSHA biogenesis protein MshJ